jgi:kynureninase
VRLLSALIPQRTRLVTTTGEFHSIRRQVDRLSEEGIDVVKIDARPANSLAARLAAVVDDRVACVLVSSVLFETAEIVPNLEIVARACEHHGVPLLVDAYHHLNIVPFDLEATQLQRAFVTGGGYKYCQLGEGNCFLRVPPQCVLRPAITGWFAEFGHLAESSRADQVGYANGADRFAGSTYDPTSHYRAAAVFAFHREMALTPERLRAISRRQVGILRAGFDELDLPFGVARVEPMPEERRAGFLAIRTPRAPAAVAALRIRGVFSDARGDVLRMGPAPYVSDDQLRDAVAALREFLRADPSF